MKTFKKICLLVLGLISTVACQNEPDKIIFNGPHIVSVANPSYSLTENAEEPLEVGFEISRTFPYDITVSFEVEENGAMEGIDYTLLDSEVTIPAGEYVGYLRISPIDNEILDAARKLTVSLTAVDDSGLQLSQETETQISLVNDDCPAKTNLWLNATAFEDGYGEYTAAFSPNEAGDCNILLVYNFADLGGTDTGVELVFTPNSEGATFGTIGIKRQGTGSFGSTGERTVEGSGTYDESTKVILVSYTIYFGNGEVYYSADGSFTGN